MPTINPLDTTFALVKQTAAGALQANAAFLKLDYIQGDEPNLNADNIESQLNKASRTSAGIRKGNYRVDGGLKTQLKRDAAVDAILENVLSNSFVSNTLKGGNTDVNLCIEKKMVDSSASTFYRRFMDCQISKVGISCEASGNAEMSFEVLGANAVTATTLSTGATYANTSTTTNLTGLDVGTFTVAGLTAVYRKLDLSIEQPRETQDRFGNPVPQGVAASGSRKVKLSATFYRTDWTPETICIPDTPIAVSFSIGTSTNGYTFTLPTAVGSIPDDSSDGSKQLVTVEFTGQFDPVTGTDMTISRP